MIPVEATGSRPFRFGVLTPGAESRKAWTALARRVEELGYATLSVDDHLYNRLGSIAAMLGAAEATTTLRIGSCVFANDFRHPLILAKEAATLDVLSGGRLELGLGTGYARTDYEQSGIALDPPRVRVDRFAEAVWVIKAAFGDGPVAFAGEHYRVEGIDLLPKPVQRPHPPLLIGGGSRRMLALAARGADIVGINVKTTPDGGFDLGSITPEATDRKVEWVREAAGERFRALELHMLAPFVAITDEPRAVAAEMLRVWGIADAIAPEELLASPHALIGSEEELVTALQERRERYGVSYVTVFEPALEAFAPVAARLAGR
ncbi:MAG: hypothetical protein QOF01_3003 [Thermomicrobiales bacterium]|nr:hypothetical protein [Thermomicrobiales bacterium]